MKMEFMQEIVRWTVIPLAIFILFSSCQMVLNLVGLDIRDLIFYAVERKKPGKHPFRAEKESRERVQEAMDNASLSVKEKCRFLNDELGYVMGSVFVSREWKDEISDRASALMKQNDLTMANFL